MIDGRFGYGVGVVADVVFVMIAVFANLIGHDGAAILQMDGISRRVCKGEKPYNSEMPYKKEDGDT